MLPDAWKKAVANSLNLKIDELFIQGYLQLIDEHFNNENLVLPPNANWKNVNASIFKVLDGKKLLFENKDSLFEKIKIYSGGSLKINRSILAQSMEANEIHIDIEVFFNNLESIVNG